MGPGLATLMAMSALACVLSTARAAAGATEDFVVKMNVGGNATTTYVSARAVRQVEPVVNVDVIYRLPEGKIITLDHKRKDLLRDDSCGARAQGAQAAAQMSPSKKEMMDRMGMNAAPTVTQLGAGETIAGFTDREVPDQDADDGDDRVGRSRADDARRVLEAGHGEDVRVCPGSAVPRSSGARRSTARC